MACEVEGCRSFAELATVVLVRQFVKKGRRADGHRLVAAYLTKHPKTTKIDELLELLAAGLTS